MKKYIFIDIDDTLLNHEVGILESTVQAIRQARKNGHKVFICTGRARSQVSSYILNVGFDGGIYSSGTAIEINDKLIFLKKLEPQLVNDIMADFKELGIGYKLEGYDNCYIEPIDAEYFAHLHIEKKLFDEDASIYNEITVKSIRDYNQSMIINKGTFFANNSTEVFKLKDLYDTKLDFTVHEFDFKWKCVEFNPPGISKATGMDVVLDYYGANINQSIGMGDSRNDMEMVQHAHIGICMGNGIEALKQVADYVTDTLKNDGLYKAFVKYELI